MEDDPNAPAVVNGSRETAALLANILDELKTIRKQTGQPLSQPSNDCARCSQETKDIEDDTPTGQLTKEARTGPILCEALRRYRTDSVPQWSAFYGAHVTSPPQSDGYGFKDQERRSAWNSLIGETWQIPHDNRISLCFLSAPTDPMVPSRVRNFLYHFHDAHANESPRGRYFNIWDWFDSGISAYWYPHKSSSDLDLDMEKRGRIEDGLTGAKEETSALAPMVAPWRRMINFQGLTTVRNCESGEKRSTVTDEDLCPFLLPKMDEAIFELPVNNIIWRAVRNHLQSKRATEANHSELLAKGCILFHLTFYEIIGPDYAPGLTELWPCGELYSNGEEPRNRRRRIRESSLTIIAAPGSEVSSSKAARSIFWTMICLRPLHFPHPYYFERRDDLSQGNHHEMIDDMSDVAHKCLLSVLDKWEEIAEFFDELLCEKRALFDPNYHDTLLTDDVALSRSKKYFWAIEFLKELEKSVTDNIRQVDRFAAFLRANPPPTSRNSRDFSARIRKQYAALIKLEALRVRFANKREEAVALRDGLFNASAVIESRMSTKLGENIKLLTFVSIFFLPLSFCTSLWSVNDDIFPLSAFVVTMPVLSICTYVISLNLDYIATFWQRLKMQAWPPDPERREAAQTNTENRDWGRFMSRFRESKRWKQSMPSHAARRMGAPLQIPGSCEEPSTSDRLQKKLPMARKMELMDWARPLESAVASWSCCG
ncbi:hypothetical protein B0T16DRAFT_23449 [Cercophora newfieldiana]|uniref:Uncharacterized protein n=1 Tax=Cercophora newfieldiana TaxID=92897 RepID=A0AA40CZ74_9PEZI|nr:hypothetical protein B0T16DRAFT_23449 [Cercophora newfieldiana]